MHTALDIARYIINKCIDLGRPVSNLQLQKILYYVQGEYMKKNDGEPLFSDEIEAWQYGPVVPDVYYNFNNYSSSEIDEYQFQTDSLNNHEISIIDPVIRDKSKIGAWQLVQDTHSESPWVNSYGRSNIIAREELYDFFRR